jgi:hypothetical protein
VGYIYTPQRELDGVALMTATACISATMPAIKPAEHTVVSATAVMMKMIFAAACRPSVEKARIAVRR